MNIFIDLNPNFLSFLFSGDRIANGISRNQGNKRSVKQIHPRIGTAKRWPWESKKVNFWTIIIEAHLFQMSYTNDDNQSLSNSKGFMIYSCMEGLLFKNQSNCQSTLFLFSRERIFFITMIVYHVTCTFVLNDILQRKI